MYSSGIILCLVLAVTFVNTEIPSYIHVCGRRNPQLNECIMNSIGQLRDKLKTGIPELYVPTLEPLTIDALKLADLPNLQADATDVKLYGLLNYTIKDLNVDFNKQMIELTIAYDKLYAEAVYDVVGKLLVQIKDKGPIHLSIFDVTGHVVMNYQLVNRKGSTYMYFPKMTVKVSIKDFKATFVSADGTRRDDTFVIAINAALSESSKEILDSTTPHIERVLSKFILNASNQFVKHFSYDELFPDKE